MNHKLILLTAAALLNALLLPAQSEASGLAAGHCSAGAIRIEHIYREKYGYHARQITAYSLATAIGPHVVLTHNHFSRRPEPGHGETLTFVECTGQTTRLAVDDLAFVVIDSGAALIILPDEVTLMSAPLAEPPTVAGVSARAQLTVNYWDEGAGRFAQHAFEVLRVNGGVATLADPGCRITPGDSGGGVFLNGGVVAGIWARYVTLEGQPAGQFDIALVSAEARRQLAGPAAPASASAP